MLIGVFTFIHAQDKKPPASPRGQASVSFADGKTVTVDYGRPYAKGRKIMGGLVPYGQVWRTGANEATSFVTDTPINISGTNVPAGKYTMYTLPGENEWKLIINKQTGQWGTEYNEPQDLARIIAKPTKLPQPVEQFTISFDKKGGNAAIMKLEWENTSVPLEITEAK
jgi:hypothetical protein